MNQSSVKVEPNLPKYSIFKMTDKEDIQFILPLFLEWKRETGDSVDELDWESIINNLYECFVKGEVYLVRDNEGCGVVGCSANIPHKGWTDKTPVVLNLCFFVSPEHRHSRIASLLLQKTKEYVKIKGLNKLILSVMSTKDTTLKDRFFKLYGFELLGGCYQWVV